MDSRGVNFFGYTSLQIAEKMRTTRNDASRYALLSSMEEYAPLSAGVVSDVHLSDHELLTVSLSSRGFLKEPDWPRRLATQ